MAVPAATISNPRVLGRLSKEELLERTKKTKSIQGDRSDRSDRPNDNYPALEAYKIKEVASELDDLVRARFTGTVSIRFYQGSIHRDLSIINTRRLAIPDKDRDKDANANANANTKEVLPRESGEEQKGEEVK